MSGFSSKAKLVTMLGLVILGLSAHATTAPALKTLYCPTVHVTGATTETCNVDLTAKATSNAVITLSATDSNLVTPNSVTVLKGHTTAKFTLTIKAVTVQESPSLKATYNGSSVYFGLVLNPVAQQTVPTLAASNTTVSFGAVTAGTTAAKTVSLTSTGTAPVSISQIAVNGGLFQVTALALPLTLNPGQSVTLTLSFTPPYQTSYDFTGTVTVTSNAPTVTINMAGSGAAAPPPPTHTVQLSWQEPVTSDPIANYNVYRAVSGSGAYAKLTTVSGLTYNDSTVSSGVTYDYYVTDIDTSGVESGPSNTATTTIP